MPASTHSARLLPSHVGRDHLIDSVNGLSVQDARIVDVDVTHACGQSGGPRASEAEVRRAPARCELGPGFAVALDQEAVPAPGPGEGVARVSVTKPPGATPPLAAPPTARDCRLAVWCA